MTAFQPWRTYRRDNLDVSRHGVGPTNPAGVALKRPTTTYVTRPRTFSTCELDRTLDGFDDAGVSGTAAEIPRDTDLDFFAIRVRVAFE